MVPAALTVAGSDPSGGAGVQADIKTFTRLKVYGMSVVTALTVQNTTGVMRVLDVPAEIIAGQLDAVMTDIPPLAMKTGMLGSAEATELVADRILRYQIRQVIVDPVFVSSSGTDLLRREAIAAFRTRLAPLALLITPNLQEARELSGIDIHDIAGMEDAARRIADLGSRNVLVKGGHLEGDAVDVFYDGAAFHHFRSQRVAARDTHGTGCVLSAAITAHLARGANLIEAVQSGKDFVTGAIRRGLRLGAGIGPCDAGEIG